MREKKKQLYSHFNSSPFANFTLSVNVIFKEWCEKVGDGGFLWQMNQIDSRDFIWQGSKRIPEFRSDRWRFTHVTSNVTNKKTGHWTSSITHLHTRTPFSSVTNSPFSRSFSPIFTLQLSVIIISLTPSANINRAFMRRVKEERCILLLVFWI